MATQSLDKTRSRDLARRQRRHSPSGSQHRTTPKDYWTKQGPQIPFGRERFRVWWVPGVGSKQNIDPNVENLTWDDATAVLTGTIQFRDPAIGEVPDVGFGDEIMVECSLTGEESYAELWRMRIDQPNRDFGAAQRTFQMINALGWAARSTDDFHYRKDKANPKGWYAHEIALDVCKRFAIPVGVIAKTTHRINKLVLLQASPLDVIAAAYKRERHATGKRFVISCYHGKLDITPLRRTPQLLELGPTLIQATFQEQFRNDFATSLKVRAQAKKDHGKDSKGKPRKNTGKIVVIVQSRAAIKRYGFVQREVWAHDAHSTAEARQQGLRHLTRIGIPKKVLTLTHPGLPQLKRGAAIRALLPDPALQQIIFVTEVQHTLNPGDYEIQVSVEFSDPFVDATRDRVTENRKQVARKRGRKNKSGTQNRPRTKGWQQHRKATPGQRLRRRGDRSHSGRGGQQP